MQNSSLLLGRFAILLAILCTPVLPRAAAHEPLWLAVARPGLAAPLAPLAEKRRGEGFEAIVSTSGVDEALKAAGCRPDFLLLVGDDEPGQEKAAWYLPAKRVKQYRWRGAQAAEYASDAAWSTLDRDGVPEFPVGRIPARSAAQVELVVKKILAFEARPPGIADLQLPAWLGSPEYGAAMDAVASGLGENMVQTRGPAWIRPRFVSGNPNDLLCGWPAEQPARFTRLVKRGGAVAVLMGHASSEAFYSMSFGGRAVRYTAADAAGEFAKGPPVEPMIFFSCEAGDFTAARPCLAKSLLLMPGGPVATIAATTESHPLTNYFSGMSFLTALGGNDDRLGAIWLRAQRQARKAHDLLMESVLVDAEGSLEKPINVEKLRRDQMLMYSLLGDPATRLHLPQPLNAKVEKTATGWRWRVDKPAGAAHLEVGYRAAAVVTITAGPKPTSAQAAGKALDAANARFDFIARPSPPDAGPWEGMCDRAGVLRLVATGSGKLYAAVIRLK